MARMMVYAWYDLDNGLGETKFGDHFVSDDMSLEEAIAHTRAYVRTQFPRRAKHFDSGRVLVEIWDVSEAAKQHKKFYGASKMDDLIRPAIKFPGTQGKEFHALPFDEVVIRVNTWIQKTQQPLPEAGLATWQANAAANVLEAIDAGKRKILAELCARFGKTIWSGVIIRETNTPLTVVASYVLTSFTSFIKDLTSFEQFKNLVHVDTKDADYQQQVAEALEAGKQVVAYVSMCKDVKLNRNERIEFLFNTTVNRLLVIDEADYGVHKAGQADILRDNVGDDDVTILMTGTNSDRAVGSWNPDYFLSVTYPELLMEKALTLKAI